MECLELIEKILLDSVEKEGYENIAGKAYAQLGYLNRFFARHSAAHRSFEKSLSFFQKTGNQYSGCIAIADCAEHYIDVNMFGEAEKLMKRASAIAADYGYSGIEARIHKIKAGMYCKQRDVKNAREHFLKCEQKLSSLENVYTAWLWKGEWLYENALNIPEYMDASIIQTLGKSPVANIPIISCYINYASAVKARDEDDRETSWSLFMKTETVSQKNHFMEIYIYSNVQLNKLHVIKTGNVSNRFLNAARRSLEKIENHLEETEQVQYLQSAVLKDSDLLVVAEGSDELSAEQNIGNIWAQKTAIGEGENIGVAKTQISGGKGALDEADSSDFIGQGIQEDLDDSDSIEPSPAKESSVLDQTISDSEGGLADTLASAADNALEQTNSDSPQGPVHADSPSPSDSSQLDTMNFAGPDAEMDDSELSADTMVESEMPSEAPAPGVPPSGSIPQNVMETRSVPPPPPPGYVKDKEPVQDKNKEPVSGIDLGITIPKGDEIPVPVKPAETPYMPPPKQPADDMPSPPDQARNVPPPPAAPADIPSPPDQTRNVPPPPAAPADIPSTPDQTRNVPPPPAAPADIPSSPDHARHIAPPPLPDIGGSFLEQEDSKQNEENKEEKEKPKEEKNTSASDDPYGWDDMSLDDSNGGSDKT